MAVLTPGLRKLALTAHVAASVGWLGAVIAYLALCVRAFNDGRRLMRVVTNPTAHGKNDVKRSLVVEKVQRPAHHPRRAGHCAAEERSSPSCTIHSCDPAALVAGGNDANQRRE
jgi:hypothetical protein